MMHDVSTGEAVYRRLKTALVESTLDPHDRLDIARLAADFAVSPTPVREAAMRLLGEGLLELHPRGGARPLQTSEYRLRSLLELHVHLTEVALRLIAEPQLGAIAPCLESGSQASYRRFFGEIAQATGNADLVTLFDHYADRLAPYRQVEPEVFSDLAIESEALRKMAELEDARALRKGMRAYHRRRLNVVPQLAWHVARRQIAAR